MFKDFLEQDFSAEKRRTFLLTYVDDPDYFVLRPKGTFEKNINACVQPGFPLSLADCGESGSEPDKVQWKIRDGKIITRKDAQCLTHNLGSNEAEATGCGTDLKFYTSIIPVPSDQLGGWVSGGTKGKVFEEVKGLFPDGGVRK